MIGRKGDDSYVVDNALDKVVELSGEGSDTVNASVNYSLAGQYAEVLNLTGGAVNGTGNGLANRIVGNGLANNLNGGAGNDRLDGGAGADTMVGGLGNDVFVVDNVADKVGEKTGEGTDTVEASISYSLAGQYIEILKLIGDANLNATGNNQANSLFGNDGANVLDGMGGADTMTGGGGDDRYVVDNVADKVMEAVGGGVDIVEASVSFTLAGQFADNLTLTGNAAINATGNGMGNVLTGNGAINTLSGGAGSDVLNGGLGNDRLSGGDGGDLFVFDSALGSNNVDAILDFAASDDTVQLDRSVFKTIAEGALATTSFVAGTAALDADDRIVFDKVSGNVWYDADGNGAGGAILFANFGAGEVLLAADFVVVA
jgi:Ca2+-binding RTX toxin-like protein